MIVERAVQRLGARGDRALHAPERSIGGEGELAIAGVSQLVERELERWQRTRFVCDRTHEFCDERALDVAPRSHRRFDNCRFQLGR